MSQRPGFQRNDTDIAQTHVGSSTSSAEVELNDMDKGGSKKGNAYFKEREVSSGASPPAYDEEDSTRGEVEVVTEAKDIQTQVIHVEDDATISPWTFRMFFLGMLISPHADLATVSLLTDSQVSASASSAQSCKRSSTSSLKSSSSPSFS